MANVNDFVNKWQGRYCEFDGKYFAQCVDIVKQWEKENGWPIVNGNAIDVPRNAPGNKYTWVRNAVNNKPSPGDIVVFNMAYPYGHIGICTSADYINLTCFEQNNPLGSRCRKVFHPLYRQVIGWLKPR